MRLVIPFNKPWLAGPELSYIREAIALGKISGNGEFTQRCHRFFESVYGMPKALLTTSGTAALEMAALLLNIQPGDEVIVPSYTFTSTANAFVLRGAHIVFADSEATHPNLDVAHVAALITPRTRAIVAVHYAGMACDMAALMALAKQHALWVVEDAAQAIESWHDQQRLGTIGHLAAFSFHETKNIIAGEGGLLAINDPQFAARAEILWEKGTNRAAFARGEVDKYAWTDIGSSFLPSELTAAYLWAQLQARNEIQRRRELQWQYYAEALRPLALAGLLTLPDAPAYARHNQHIFYLLTRSAEEQAALLKHMQQQGILAVAHYQALHASPYYQARHQGGNLPHAQRYTHTLVRLPLFMELTTAEQDYIIAAIEAFYCKDTLSV